MMRDCRALKKIFKISWLIKYQYINIIDFFVFYYLYIEGLNIIFQQNKFI